MTTLDSAKTTFLHISDFHCNRSSQCDAKGPFSQSIVDIQKWCKNHPNDRIDAVFISGDIAACGKEDEYKLATPIIDKILEVTKLTKNQLFIVPGNHDVDFSKITKPELESIHSILDGRNSMDDYLINYDDYKIFLEKFRAYADFSSNIGNPLASWVKSDGKLAPWFSIPIVINGIKFRIVGLTTSFLANNKKELTHGSVQVGKQQIQEALLHKEPGEFVIVLSHHPIDWYNEGENWLLQVLIGKEKAIYLHGHSHHHRSYFTQLSPEIEYVCLSAGSMYSGSKFRNKYHIFQIHFQTPDSKCLKVWPREWKTDAQRWDVDPEWESLDKDQSWTKEIFKLTQINEGIKTKPTINNTPYKIGNIPLSFTNFPRILKQTVDKEGSTNLAVVIGSGRYLHSDHVSYGTDCLFLPEFISMLKDKKDLNLKVNSCLDIDIFNTPNISEKNLLIIGSGKVNFVTMKLLEYFGDSLKFKITPMYNLVISKMKGETIYRDGQDKDWGLGIACLTANPWALEKGNKRIALLIAGFHPLGSIAAANLICTYIRKESGENNLVDKNVPMKIVSGKPITFSKYHKRVSEALLSPINTPTYIGSLSRTEIIE